MRNLLVHDYFRINDQIVWETLETHLPVLKAEKLEARKVQKLTGDVEA